MGHADHAHGRVFRGIKKVSSNNKRSSGYSDNVHQFIHRRQADVPSHNTNGDRIKMNVPEGFAKNGQTVSDGTGSKFAQKAQADNVEGDNDVAVETVFAQVFTTLDQTFDGPPQFFSTQKVEPTSTRASQAAAQTTAAAADNSRQQNNNDNDNDQTPSRKPVAQATSTSASTLVPTTSSAAPSNTASAKDDDATSTHSAIHVTSSSIVTGDVASTRGAQLADHTSSAIAGTPISATNSPSDTPEQTGMTGGAKAGLAVGILFGLALVFGLIFFCWRRKKSQRELEEHNEKSAAAPVPVNRFSADSEKLRRTSTQTSATAPRLSLRPVTQFLPNLTGSGNGQAASQNPFGDAAVVSDKAAAGHDRANSVNSDSNASVDSAGTAAAPGSAQVATAAAVPVTPRGPNNVHRVQLEFKPSMEDELELKSGQLVRMLHEYDDGWALCAKMDRSQKGVVPRTCLSKMPVKPRGPPPQNGHPHAGPNGMPTPPPGANVPGPLTPTQQGRPRAPTLDGVPARKPVPGQAL